MNASRKRQLAKQLVDYLVGEAHERGGWLPDGVVRVADDPQASFERIAQQTGSPLVRMNFDSADIDPSLESVVGIQGDMAQTLPVVLGE